METVTAAVKSQGVKSLVRITVDAAESEPAELVATEAHPFWVPELGEWVHATDLRSGQWLRTSAGTHVQVTAVERWTVLQARVHNLTVANSHTYYVLAGTTPVLVHNCTPKQVAADYRADAANGVGGRRNVAVAQHDIDGVPGQHIGVSGQHTNPGSVAAPTNRVFDPGERPFDSENKIFEHYAANLGSDARGTINLYSERVPCPSCSSVIDQFRERFPGVQVNVSWG